MVRSLVTVLLLGSLVLFPAVNVAQSETVDPHTRIYAGRIGDGLRIHLKLGVDSDKLSGSYYYDKYQTDLGLAGGVNLDGSFVITEFTDHSTGLFEGRFTGKGRAQGEWSDLSGTRKLPFVLFPVDDPLAYFVEEHIARNESILRKQGVLYEFDKSRLVRIAADFDNDGRLDWAFRDTGGWSMNETAEYSVFFRNPEEKGFSRMTLVLFNPATDYLLPVRKGMAQVVRRWENPPVNGEFNEEFVTGEYLKPGRRFPVTYVNGKMRFKDPQGLDWLKRSGKKGALPVRVDGCMLRDYLRNKDSWKSSKLQSSPNYYCKGATT